MKTDNFALRLPDSLCASLKQAAAADNVTMNQYMTIGLWHWQCTVHHRRP